MSPLLDDQVPLFRVQVAFPRDSVVLSRDSVELPHDSSPFFEKQVAQLRNQVALPRDWVVEPHLQLGWVLRLVHLPRPLRGDRLDREGGYDFHLMTKDDIVAQATMKELVNVFVSREERAPKRGCAMWSDSTSNEWRMPCETLLASTNRPMGRRSLCSGCFTRQP